MTRKEFERIKEKVKHQNPKPEKDEWTDFWKVIDSMIDLLDEDDLEDVHGSEGWRHMVGID